MKTQLQLSHEAQLLEPKIREKVLQDVAQLFEEGLIEVINEIRQFTYHCAGPFSAHNPGGYRIVLQQNSLHTLIEYETCPVYSDTEYVDHDPFEGHKQIGVTYTVNAFQPFSLDAVKAAVAAKKTEIEASRHIALQRSREEAYTRFGVCQKDEVPEPTEAEYTRIYTMKYGGAS